MAPANVCRKGALVGWPARSGLMTNRGATTRLLNREAIAAPSLSNDTRWLPCAYPCCDPG